MFNKKEQNSDSQWIPISDLMSVLMMVFLFIAIVYMINVKSQKDKIQKIAVNYNKLRLNLYKDLQTEFKEDLGTWVAVIDSTSLSVKFKSRDVLFKAGKYELRDTFKIILKEFFPRYIKILASEKYKNEIDEIRIEGHTSSEYGSNLSSDSSDSYFKNMELSQDRTREVLKYLLNLDSIKNRNEVNNWVKKRISANGLSSSKLIFKNGIEDKEASRRVEFKVNTKSLDKIVEILNME